MRKLTLDRDALLELDGGDLLAIPAAAGGPTGPAWQCVSKVVGCNTADTWCEFTYGC